MNKTFGGIPSISAVTKTRMEHRTLDQPKNYDSLQYAD